MTVQTNSKGLGKGLSALMGEDYSLTPQSITISPASTARDGLNELPVDRIHSGKFQPRSHFDETYLSELADSIEKNGVMQPIIVRPSQQKDGHYEIIAGERRWRASKMAKVGTIPAIIRDIDDQLALELALVENIQRQDLSVLEEANGYQRLIDEFGYTQEELSHTVGKSRSHIANLLRLLFLPPSIKRYLETGDLTMGHARALLNSDKAETYAEIIVRRGLNVRQTEMLVKEGSVPEKKPSQASDRSHGGAGNLPPRNAKEKDQDIIALEQSISQHLGMPVEIHSENASQGEISIRYDGLSQLDELIRLLGSRF